MPGLTCNACNKEFEDDLEQKLHYKSEWHRYNLKRKVAGVPGVTEALFLAKQSALTQEKNKLSEIPMIYSCALCAKEYRSVKAHAQHLKSRSHILRASQGAGDNQSVGDTVIKPLHKHAKNISSPQTEVDNQSEDSEDEWEEVDTVIDDVGLNDTAGFSLHLTLGIEVEPPFEWEGFAHIAVHCWYRNQQNLYASGILNIMSVNLLHVAVRLIGHRDPTFRKSCLVAALSLMSDTTSKKLIDTLDLNQRSIFSYMIDKICGESRFWEAFETVKEAMGKNEDPFHQMRWLEHLPVDGEITGHNCVNAFMKIEELLPLCNGQKDQVEAAFLVVRSNFCHDVVFEDVVKSYKMMLEKYRNVRKQYMNGMLSLHCS